MLLRLIYIIVSTAIIALCLTPSLEISAALLVGATSLPAAAISPVERSEGCFHNGTHFADDSVVPTLEPCLTCKCTNRTLICNLRICPEMPLPPPRGCVLVHKRNGCCPYLSCTKFHRPYDGPNRKIIAYLDQFDRETLDRVVSENLLQRRSDDGDFENSGEICVHNGTVYKSGSAMSSSNLCTYCYCIGGVQKCVKPKCILSMAGCKPIFVDSTCCPIRYDCSSKSSGMFKSQNYKKKSNNKHYQRMISRLQRSRGCVQNSHFYMEGQKMPSLNLEDDCEVCFCIRGSKKCTPKKCAPMLRNCMPVVPKGQCCPSSYDCNNFRDPGKARQLQSDGRQFDFFSLIFGGEENENSTVESSEEFFNKTTELIDAENELSNTTEKGFFDVLKEAFLETENRWSNTTHEDIKLAVNKTNSSTDDGDDNTDFGILDILLGNVSETDLNITKATADKLNTEAPVTDAVTNSTAPVTKESDEDDDENFSWFDILLGTSSTNYTPTVAEERNGDDFTTEQSEPTSTLAAESKVDDYPDYSSELDATEEDQSTGTENTTDQYSSTSEMKDTTVSSTLDQLVEESTIVLKKFDSNTEKSMPTTLIMAETTFKTTTPRTSSVRTATTKAPTFKTTSGKNTNRISTTEQAMMKVKIIEPEVKSTTEKPATIKLRIVKPAPTTTAVEKDFSTTESNFAIKTPTTMNSKSVILSTPKNKTENKIFVPVNLVTKPTNVYTDQTPSYLETNSPGNFDNSTETNDDFLSALFTGLSSIFEDENNSTAQNLTATEKHTIFTESKDTSTKQKDAQDDNIEIVMANLTKIDTKLDAATEKEFIQILPSSEGYPTKNPSFLNYTTDDLGHLTSHHQTEKPMVIKTNPTILESDLNLDYNDPTLPPSLPNLKIIPFLPTDALKTDRKTVAYDAYPSITEKHDTWNLETVGVPQSNTKLKYEIYDPTGRYPSITENYDSSATIYPEEFSGKNKYSYSDYNGYSEFAIPEENFNVVLPKHDQFIDDLTFVQAGPFDGQHKETFGTPGFEKFATIFTEKNADFKNGPFGPPTEGYVNKFSPPTKTEGGFLPKETLDEQFFYDNYHTTKFLVDITTNTPPTSTVNVTIFVPDTTSTLDPFKDVIKTESPPNLNLLIEDKEKLMANGPFESSVDDHSDIDFEKDIISITTDSTYNYTSEYEVADKSSSPKIYSNQSSYEDVSTTTTVFPELPTYTETVRPIIQEDTPASTLLGETSKETVNDLELEEVLGILLREEDAQNETIPFLPPFKNLPENSFTTTKVEPINRLTAEQNSPEQSASLKTLSSPSREDLSFLKHALFSSFNHFQEAEKFRPSSKPLPNLENHASDSLNAFFSEPFNKLPFLNPSFPVKANDANLVNSENFHHNPLNSDLDLRIPEQSSNFGIPKETSFQIHSTESIVSQTDPHVVNPVDIDKLKQHQSDGQTEIFTKPIVTNSIKDPAGILKLAGCNIYGRMYRVGRIISELSGPCLECKCTEVGVHCNPLNC